MSMIARFVAITPDQLATIKDTPEMVGGVFALDAGLPFESPSDLGKRLRRQTPQLVADMLERVATRCARAVAGAARLRRQRPLQPGRRQRGVAAAGAA